MRTAYNLFKFNLLFFLLSAELSSMAQQKEIDSLRRLLSVHTKEDTTRVRITSLLGYYYHNVIPDSTIILAQKAYLLSIKINDEQGIADALKYWAIGASILGDSKTALEKNYRALAIYEKLGDKRGGASLVNNIAIIHHNQGELAQAQTYYHRSLKIRKEINDVRGIAASYNNIGNVYTDMGNYSEALYYLFQALKLREKLNDSSNLGNSYGNIAGVYYLLNKYDEALSYGLKGYQLHEKSGNKDGLFQAFSVIGGVYHKKGENKKAQTYFEKSIRLCEELKTYNALSIGLINMGELLLEQQKYNESEHYYDRALSISKKYDFVEGRVESRIGLCEIYQKTDRFKQSIDAGLKSIEEAEKLGIKPSVLKVSKLLAEAYEQSSDIRSANRYLKKYIQYKDSVFSEENDKKVQELTFSFKLDRKQKEIALLQKDKSIKEGENQRQRLITTVLMFGLGILLLFLFILYKSRQKERISKDFILKQKHEIEEQAKALTELNSFKDKTFSVLSHDLRSPVASLTNVMMLLQDHTVSREDFQHLQHNLNDQLRSLSLLLDNMLNWARNHMQGETTTNKKPFLLGDLIRNNMELYKEPAQQKQVSLLLGPLIETDVLADADQIDIVIRNLVSNAIKFTESGGHVMVSVLPADDNKVLVCVQDDGIGVNEATKSKLFSNELADSNYGTQGEKGTGLGLFICKEFVEKNEGEIFVESREGEGAKFCFTLHKA